MRADVTRCWGSGVRAISALAKCPNVVAKLGGINMEINGFGWHERDLPPTSQALMEATRPYYEHTMAQFGVERCMFESNFPVDKVSCSYNVLWNSFKRLTAQYSADEKAQLFHDRRRGSIDSKRHHPTLAHACERASARHTVICYEETQGWNCEIKSPLSPGGARGIGKGMALALARQGVHVAVADLYTSSRGTAGYAFSTEQEVNNSGRELTALGVRAIGVPVDVTQWGQVQELMESVTQRLGPIDILCNNAGVIDTGLVVETTEAQWEQ